MQIVMDDCLWNENEIKLKHRIEEEEEKNDTKKKEI